MRRRFSLILVTFLLLSGVSLLIGASMAGAQISGPCTATMNGANVNSISTSGSALQVPSNGSVSINFQSTGPITGHEVFLEFIGGIKWKVASGSDDGNSWSDSVAVANYAKYGVGLYRVTGQTQGGGACSGAAFVRVTGKNPLTTAAGAAGAAASVIGLAGMAGAGVMASGREAGEAARLAASGPPRTASLEELLDESDELLALHLMGFCLLKVPMAMMMTLAGMLTGAGAPAGAPALVRWKPRISIGSLIGALLAGLGTLVLCQQFALFFPTIAVLILWLAGWLLIGVAVPSLARLYSVHKANDILNWWLAQGPQVTGQGPASEEGPQKGQQ